MKISRITNILKKYKIKIFFSFVGILSSLITYVFYYKDFIGLTTPFLIFLIFCYYFGREKKFFKVLEDNFLLFFVFWLITLTILMNL